MCSCRCCCCCAGSFSSLCPLLLCLWSLSLSLSRWLQFVVLFRGFSRLPHLFIYLLCLCLLSHCAEQHRLKFKPHLHYFCSLSAAPLPAILLPSALYSSFLTLFFINTFALQQQQLQSLFLLLCLSTDFVYSSSFYRRHFSICLLVLSSSVPTSLHFPPSLLLPALTLFGVQSKVRHEVHSSGSSCQLCLLLLFSLSFSASQIIAKTVNLLNSPRLTANLLRDLCFMYFFTIFSSTCSVLFSFCAYKAQRFTKANGQNYCKCKGVEQRRGRGSGQ